MSRRLIFLFLYIFYGVCRIFWRPREVAVLMYHSIGDSGWFFAVKPEEFERQMRYLCGFFNPVRLSDIVDFMNGKKDLPLRSVAVTFDDGYRDFLTEAVPVLNKYQIPATIFVCAGEVDRKELGNNLTLLNWEEIKELKKNNLIEIGSHCLTHRKLTRLNSAYAENEIKLSRVIISDKIGSVPDFLAYPKGSFSADIMDITSYAGYAGAVSVAGRTLSSYDAPHSIPRIQVDGSHSFLEFRALPTRVSGWYRFLWTFWKKRL